MVWFGYSGLTCTVKVHTDFLFVGFSRLCYKRLGEESVRGSGVRQGIRGEEVREGGRRVEALHVASVPGWHIALASSRPAGLTVHCHPRGEGEGGGGVGGGFL